MRKRSWLLIAALCLTCQFTPHPANAQPEKKNPVPRLDHYGDKLPEHAVLRIGTTRLQPAGLVTAMAFTADGKRLTTLNTTSGGHTWDVATGKELLAFGRAANKDAPFAVSADGSLAAIVESADICRLYDTSTGRETRAVKGPFTDARALCLSPDKKHLASAEPSGLVLLWDAATGALIRRWMNGDQGDSYLPSLAFSPDGKILAVDALGSSVRLWDVDTGKHKVHTELGTGCSSLCFSADGTMLLAIRGRGDFQVVADAVSGKLINGFFSGGHHSPLISCAGFMPDCKSIVAGQGGFIRVEDLPNFKNPRTFGFHESDITSLTATTDGKLLATAHKDGIVRLWDFKTEKLIHDFAGRQAPFMQAQFTSDAKKIIATYYLQPYWLGGHLTAGFWDSTSGKSLGEVRLHNFEGSHLWVNVGQVFVFSYLYGQFGVQDLSTGKETLLKPAIGGDGRTVHEPYLSADGRYLVLRGWHGPPDRNLPPFQVWDLAGGKVALSMTAARGADYFCGVTGDGRFLALYSNYPNASKEQATVEFWDIPAGRKVIRPGPPLTSWETRIFSPNGQLVAAATSRWQRGFSNMPIWELATGKLVLDLSASKAKIDCVAFSTDGAIIAIGTDANEILLWNLHSQKPIATLSGHRGRVCSLDFSPDGKQLVSASDDTTILVWNVSPWTDRTKMPAVPLGKAAPQLWSALASDDPTTAYSAVGKLLKAPKETVAILRQLLQPVQPAQAKEIAQSIANLDSDRYADREQAQARLQGLGFRAVPALEKAMVAKPSLEVRVRVEQLFSRLKDTPLAAGALQELRALAVLEMLATKDATDLLDSLARGEPDAWLTQEAIASLERARKRSAP